MFDKVYKNEYGFYTLKNIPPPEELSAFYTEAYHKNSNPALIPEYERSFIKAKLEQKLLLVERHTGLHGKSFLDIGCGKGFAVDFFDKKGYDVLGLDFSNDGVKNVNPGIVDKLIVGDVNDSLDCLSESGRSFCVVNLDNVLEHVADPLVVVKKACNVLSVGGVMIVKVPNEFSVIQTHFVEQDIVSYPRWVVCPDHISYFNKDGLIALCAAVGLECVDFLGDSLVELSAFNPNTNYFKNPAIGHSCHKAHIEQEILFHSVSPEKTIDFYRVLGSMGIGRQIIGVFKHKDRLTNERNGEQ